jgi:hypothetical protein
VCQISLDLRRRGPPRILAFSAAARRATEKRSAIDAIIEIIQSHPDLVLVALGPLTNIALALQKSPAIASKLGRCVSSKLLCSSRRSERFLSHRTFDMMGVSNSHNYLESKTSNMKENSPLQSRSPQVEIETPSDPR